jgi:SAM-dependent methyltransferase
MDREFILDKEDTCLGDVTDLPLRNSSVDLLICNHLYEHIDPSRRESFFRELRRVLTLDGVVYMAAGNRFRVMEPHYRLPFLSWLPSMLAGAYLRITGRGKGYTNINFLSYSRLRRELAAAGLLVRDITHAVLVEHQNRLERKHQRMLAHVFSRLPAGCASWFLSRLSAQWFFILRRS